MEKRRDLRTSPQALQGLEIRQKKPQHGLRKASGVRALSREGVPEREQNVFRGHVLEQVRGDKGKNGNGGMVWPLELSPWQ